MLAVQMLRPDPDRELARQPSDTPLGCADPVSAEVDRTPLDRDRVHLAAHPLARLEQSDRSP